MAARLCSLAALVPLLSLGMPPAVSAQAPPAFQLLGRVVSATGRVVDGAHVVLRSTAGERKTEADASGEFRFPAVPAGDYRVVASAIGLSSVAQTIAVGPEPPAELMLVLPDIVRERINVVAHASSIEHLPGSAQVIGAEEMDRLRMATDDIHRMLRQVPGVNIQEEEGFGLRPNIGMRGTGTDRSSKITMMEDGVLVAPAPYSAPAAYYSPVAGRMESIEIRKGSSQIKSGPMTTGGVINYVSTAIPGDFRVRGDVSGGSHETRRVLANVGDSYANFGWLVETFQLRSHGFKQLDGGGETGADVEDYLAKLKFNTTPTTAHYQELEIKLGRTTQTGDETYLGLTDVDFARTPLRRYAGSQADVFNSTHEQYQARHLLARRSWDVTTVAYRNDFQRSWYKLQSVLGAGLGGVLADPDRFATEMGVLTGNESAANALLVRDNNRTYYGGGLQSVFGATWATPGVHHKLEAGIRYHRDEEDRFQHDDAYEMTQGRMVLTRVGTPGSQTNQVVGARAIAGFVVDTMSWGGWSVAPGIRYETIDFERIDYARTDPSRTGATATVGTSVRAVVPGLGVSYAARPGAVVFGGVHKGFAPPGPGLDADTAAEESVNYELGVRLAGAGAATEIVGFFNDYSNLLGRDTLSAGGSGEGDLFNGGEARVYGVEASAQWNPLERAGAGFSLPLRLAYTFTSAEFRNSFSSRYEPWGTVLTGDVLPYVPPHQLFLSVDVDRQVWRMRLDTSYVSRMRSQAGQGPYDSSSATDAAFVVGLSGEYALGAGVTAFGSVQNLADRSYVVARHPFGARPGLPRTATVGLRVLVGR